MTKDEKGRTPLMQASFHGQLGMVQRLLGVSGAEGLAERDVEGWTALHCAAHEGHEDVLTLLLSHGADLNCKDHEGCTPLMEAAYRGHLGVARKLLEVEGEQGLAERAEHGMTALDYAAHGGHEEMVAWLLSHGAQANSKDKDGHTTLIHASFGGHVGVAQRLLAVVGEQGLAAKDEHGMAALDYAAQEGHEEMVAWLLSHGAQANNKDKDGMTPLMHASFGGHLGVAQRLVEVVGEQGLAERAEHGMTALDYAAQEGQEEMVAWLLSHGAQANSKDKDGHTTLIHASFGGHVGAAQRLLAVVGEQGLAAKDEHGMAALDYAAQEGHEEMVAWLLSQGAQANNKGKDGRTPLMHASYGGHLGVVQTLMPVIGITGLAERDEDGMTALYHAAFGGYEEVVTFLLSMGAQVNTTDHVFRSLITDASAEKCAGPVKVLIRHVGKQALQERAEDGQTVLHLACQRDCAEDLVRALLLAGADPSLTDNQGRTPRAQAVLLGHDKLVAVFDVSNRSVLLFRCTCEVMEVLSRQGDDAAVLFAT
jgi:ankyrin repeat protein